MWAIPMRSNACLSGLVADQEEEVGRGIASSFVESSEIFVTLKLWNKRHRPDKRLKNLQLDCLDSYLIHWPVAFFLLDDCPIEHTWHAMEKLVKDGKVRSIGVSNFTKEKLKELLRYVVIPPTVNQIGAHPYLQQSELLDFCKESNIVVTVYSSLGNNIYNIPRVKLAKEPAQVLISWAVQAELPSFQKVSLHHESNPISVTLCFRSTILPKISILEKNLRMNLPMRWGYNVFGEAGEEEVTKVAKKLAEERVKAKAARKYAWM
ncbi:aldehyde reductase-like protein [Lipomyces doorenjongii]